MTKNEANEIIVGLSKPGKMPCKAYSIPAQRCKTGSKLREVPGSICSGCYARKGNYCFPNVTDTLERRYSALQNPLWVQAMVHAIGNDKFFRWHDSGDIQSMAHLKKIVKVCEATPHCKHWLPTKEKGILKRYLASGGVIPHNLTVRLSAAMIDAKPPIVPNGVLTSTVHKEEKHYGIECKAYKQGGKCHDCRACWDKSVTNVSYPKH